MDGFVGTYGTVMVGGALIGVALVLLRALTGRMTSASGMVGSLLGGREGLAAASMAFLAGLFIAPLVLTALGSKTLPPVEAGWPWLVAGGLLVGFGARLGEGSLIGTLAGMARGSGRSLAVMVALVAGAGAALVLRQVLAAEGVA